MRITVAVVGGPSANYTGDPIDRAESGVLISSPTLAHDELDEEFLTEWFRQEYDVYFEPEHYPVPIGGDPIVMIRVKPAGIWLLSYRQERLPEYWYSMGPIADLPLAGWDRPSLRSPSRRDVRLGVSASLDHPT